MTNQEIWKPIPAWEGYYSASSHGRIKSEDRYITEKNTGKLVFHKGKILKPWIARGSGKGYLYVGLCKGTDCKTKISVHRLILWAFVGLQKKGIDARHLDGNCKNNNLSNLIYGSRKDNVKDAIKHGTFNKPKKLTKENVIKICEMGCKQISSKIVSEIFGINRNTVTEIWRGEIWGHITQGLLPKSNRNIKYNKLNDEDINLIRDNTKQISSVAKMLNIDRHTAARWRKIFNQIA